MLSSTGNSSSSSSSTIDQKNGEVRIESASKDRSDSTDSLANPKKSHPDPQGISMYYHNIQFLGGGPGHSSVRYQEVIDKLGERVSKCDLGIFVEVMDGTRKGKQITPKKRFEDIVDWIENQKNTIDQNPPPKEAKIREDAKTILEDARLVSESFYNTLNLQLTDKLINYRTACINKNDAKRGDTQAKAVHKQAGEDLKTFATNLRGRKSELINGHSNSQSLSKDALEEKQSLSSSSTSGPTSTKENPGVKELERISEAATRYSAKQTATEAVATAPSSSSSLDGTPATSNSDNPTKYKSNYQTLGNGAGEGVGLVYDSSRIKVLSSQTIELVKGIKGVAFFEMETTETEPRKFGVIGAHLPFTNEEARIKCLEVFHGKVNEFIREENINYDIMVAGDFNITQKMEEMKCVKGNFNQRDKPTSKTGEDEYDRTFLLRYDKDDKKFSIENDVVLHRVTRTVEKQEITDHLGFHIDYRPTPSASQGTVNDVSVTPVSETTQNSTNTIGTSTSSNAGDNSINGTNVTDNTLVSGLPSNSAKQSFGVGVQSGVLPTSDSSNEIAVNSPSHSDNRSLSDNVSNSSLEVQLGSRANTPTHNEDNLHNAPVNQTQHHVLSSVPAEGQMASSTSASHSSSSSSITNDPSFIAAVSVFRAHSSFSKMAETDSNEVSPSPTPTNHSSKTPQREDLSLKCNG